MRINCISSTWHMIVKGDINNTCGLCESKQAWVCKWVYGRVTEWVTGRVIEGVNGIMTECVSEVKTGCSSEWTRTWLCKWTMNEWHSISWFLIRLPIALMGGAGDKSPRKQESSATKDPWNRLSWEASAGSVWSTVCSEKSSTLKGEEKVSP